jgi:hypothetical protein
MFVMNKTTRTKFTTYHGGRMVPPHENYASTQHGKPINNHKHTTNTAPHEKQKTLTKIRKTPPLSKTEYFETLGNIPAQEKIIARLEKTVDEQLTTIEKDTLKPVDNPPKFKKTVGDILFHLLRCQEIKNNPDSLLKFIKFNFSSRYRPNNGHMLVLILLAHEINFNELTHPKHIDLNEEETIRRVYGINSGNMQNTFHKNKKELCDLGIIDFNKPGNNTEDLFITSNSLKQFILGLITPEEQLQVNRIKQAVDTRLKYKIAKQQESTKKKPPNNNQNNKQTKTILPATSQTGQSLLHRLINIRELRNKIDEEICLSPNNIILEKLSTLLTIILEHMSTNNDLLEFQILLIKLGINFAKMSDESSAILLKILELENISLNELIKALNISNLTTDNPTR